jgi:hypothetical protein
MEQEDHCWLRFFYNILGFFDELEGSISKRGIVLLCLLWNADVSRSVQGNLFMKRRLSLGMRPPTQIP